ncbi:aldose epimerase family protein [Yoonia sediminilitoris]|uniref:Aldose 1-epimerase n=1 Tax=Yoonia sediminilitoris TaxID=1286148 RepID=A0A2T6K7M3_9RHOB|nr:aldose epimerase family protein [Yoonia sediminilitoris]PUB10684.1 aldose 1-epimerase [Yoonia sediminilitoris]RCW90436.1 aldose 1-epimerase [Yoonia sediminilitoris]
MRPFGTTARGQEVHQIKLQAGDLTVQLLTLGVMLQDVRLAGVDHNLTLGSDNLADYEGAMRHHGSLIGPIVNRISNARIRLGGMMHELERNQDGRIHLHSGAEGTHLQVWTVAEVSSTHAVMTLTLPDGMCGLPGNRHITARFEVAAPAMLTLTITGTTDEVTAMNFANHSYWNLDGSDRWDGHQLWIDADRYLPSTADDYPTGEICDVTGTEMDFRQARVITVKNPPFDNNFCLSDRRTALREVLSLRGNSGVTMRLATTEPGLQIYDGRTSYKGLAVEAQSWPDAPNNPTFPSIKVGPDAPYNQITRWQFAQTSD